MSEQELGYVECVECGKGEVKDPDRQGRWAEIHGEVYGHWVFYRNLCRPAAWSSLISLPTQR